MGVAGFSKFSKEEKLQWIVAQFANDPEHALQVLQGFWHQDADVQRIFDGFSENTISNFFLPFGIAPNFLIDGATYAIPMVIEESSVVAAASSAAKFWQSRGGFQTEIIDTIKLGQLHFSWSGSSEKLYRLLPELKMELLADVQHLTANMEKRGGGILDIELLDFTDREPDYFQLKVSFETCDSMGANFINSVLEAFGQRLQRFVAEHPEMKADERNLTIIMAILSNYTPDCLVRAMVSCPVEQLNNACEGMDGATFAEKFSKAVRIAHIDPYRATTHNKGIFNGIDAVVLATGNDFRAVEACGHTYAAHDGSYRSLSHCVVENGVFRFWLDLPIALGTVGGLTKLHPLAKLSLEIMGQPSARQLMSIIASAGLAQNFAAVRSLVTTGIQKGHMKMHLMNILNHLEATESESRVIVHQFVNEAVSFSAVRDHLTRLRQSQAYVPHDATETANLKNR
jgi:hydroxymethylglutaryl-CoA reductase